MGVIRSIYNTLITFFRVRIPMCWKSSTRATVLSIRHTTGSTWTADILHGSEKATIGALHIKVCCRENILRVRHCDRIEEDGTSKQNFS